MAGGRFLGDRLLSALGPILLLRLSGLSAAAGLALALLMRTPEVAIAGFILVGFGLSNLVPILFGSAGRHRTGAGPGIAAVTTIGYSGFLIGPPLIGTLASFFGLPAALSLVCFWIDHRKWRACMLTWEFAQARIALSSRIRQCVAPDVQRTVCGCERCGKIIHTGA
jgi:MFS family permease